MTKRYKTKRIQSLLNKVRDLLAREKKRANGGSEVVVTEKELLCTATHVREVDFEKRVSDEEKIYVRETQECLKKTQHRMVGLYKKK